MCSKCSGNFLRRTGWPLTTSAVSSVATAHSASATAALSSSRVKGTLPAIHLLGGLTEPSSAQLRQLELQVFDLLIPLAELNILGLRGGVMLDNEALKSCYIIR